MVINARFFVLSKQIKFFIGMASWVLMIIVLLANDGYAGNTEKAKQGKPNEIVVFDKNVPSNQRAAIIEIANAIRSGNVEVIKKYMKKGDNPQDIVTFWSSVDKLSNLRFIARKWNKNITLSEAQNGMSSCDLVYDGNRLIIGECTFNDGN